MSDETKPEPSAYALYRQLKAAGVVSSVVSSGELLVAVDEPVPNAPPDEPSIAVGKD